jgi:molybdenum cofactor cytidylyltransferase
LITALILAAGMSRRMGQPKLVLPWGDTSVIEHIVHTLLAARVDRILVVSGAAHAQVAELLQGLPVRIVFNPQYQQQEMLVSVKVGLQEAALQAASGSPEAGLICLGDQPQMKASVIEAVTTSFTGTRANLVVPSFNRRRGHPWLIARPLWDELIRFQPEQTLRDFLNAHQAEIHYVDVDTDTILQDIDTPEDYQRFLPSPGL